MIDPPVKVGVIGCGAQGKNHLRVIKELGMESAIVSAFCGPQSRTVAGRARDVARGTGN